MSRKVMRVPLDFDHPLETVWPGYLMPENLQLDPCPACEDGYSEQARHYQNLWYGHDATFIPEKPWQHQEPRILARASRNVEDAPNYYANDPDPVMNEAKRLTRLWNSQWCHHLTQEDVDALVEAGRLMDFTHTWTKGDGWTPKDPRPEVTAEAVNLAYLVGFGHDSINAHVVIKARCAREGVPEVCNVCGGTGTAEKYPGQKAEHDAWEPTDPPTGDGWQLWETTSEGSPITPVFTTAFELISHIASPAYTYGAGGRQGITMEQATALVEDGWAPTASTIGGKVHTAEESPLAWKETDQ